MKKFCVFKLSPRLITANFAWQFFIEHALNLIQELLIVDRFTGKALPIVESTDSLDPITTIDSLC